ncbi:hypothetical protein B0H13DRAFT_1066792 [Mycena leptocephala]|nr:hypothetical protein B0H13DRAFT_1066792 [Mycena leptocephala]
MDTLAFAPSYVVTVSHHSPVSDSHHTVGVRVEESECAFHPPARRRADRMTTRTSPRWARSLRIARPLRIATSPSPSSESSPAALDCFLVRSESSPCARARLLAAGKALHKRLAPRVGRPNSGRRAGRCKTTPLGRAACARAMAYTAVDGRRAPPLPFVRRAGLATGWTRRGARLSGCGCGCGCGGAEVELDGREEDELGCVPLPASRPSPSPRRELRIVGRAGAGAGVEPHRRRWRWRLGAHRAQSPTSLLSLLLLLRPRSAALALGSRLFTRRRSLLFTDVLDVLPGGRRMSLGASRAQRSRPPSPPSPSPRRV